MTAQPHENLDPTPDEPAGLPGGVYGVDEEFIEEHAEEALEKGEKTPSDN